MEFDVTVYLVLPEVTGEGARGQWKKQEVVFNLPGEFNRKLCVGFWNDRAPMAAALRPGDHVMVSVNLESRERNGRWFTEARGWNSTNCHQSVLKELMVHLKDMEQPLQVTTIVQLSQTTELHRPLTQHTTNHRQPLPLLEYQPLKVVAMTYRSKTNR
ncbi:MAG: DUF3127 domain-containing protein [Mucinivorans sp.]